MQKHTTNRGFTLIEVIVSVGILAIISILFITVFSRMVEINMANKKINDASLKGASEITQGNFNCRSGSNIAPLSFNGNTFTVSAQMCDVSSQKKYKLFRVVGE